MVLHGQFGMAAGSYSPIQVIPVLVMWEVSIYSLKQQVSMFLEKSRHVRVFLWRGHVPPHADNFCEIPTALDVEPMAPYPLSASFTRVSFSLIIVLDLSVGYGIPFLKYRGHHTYLDTTTLSTPCTGSLRSHKACSPRESGLEHKRPQLTPILTKISQTDMGPDQISTADFGPITIISSRRCSSLLHCCNKSQPT